MRKNQIAFFMLLFSFVSVFAETTAVICIGDRENYLFEIERTQHWSSAKMTTIVAGMPINQCEALFIETDAGFGLSLIEANNLRSVMLARPMPTLYQSSKVIWGLSPYRGHDDTESEVVQTCYNVFGFDDGIRQKITSSAGFTGFVDSATNEISTNEGLQVLLPREFTFELLDAFYEAGGLKFLITVRWSIPELSKDCVARIKTSSDFNEISVGNNQDGSITTCDF